MADFFVEVGTIFVGAAVGTVMVNVGSVNVGINAVGVDVMLVEVGVAVVVCTGNVSVDVDDITDVTFDNAAVAAGPLAANVGPAMVEIRFGDIDLVGVADSTICASTNTSVLLAHEASRVVSDRITKS